jgi:glycosyltransferase involved in cell wall biosynthesis
MKDTLIIIPAYNEGKTIGRLLDGIMNSQAGELVDILVINDKSTDNTAEAVKAFGKKVILLNHIFNMGYGAALKTGYFYAVKNDYDYVIQIDADGQHAVENIKVLYEEIRSINAPDIIIGSRFMEGSVSFPISMLKKTAIRFFRVLIRLFTHNEILDPTSGLQALKKKVFTYYTGYMNFDPKYPDADMIIKMLSNKGNPICHV